MIEIKNLYAGYGEKEVLHGIHMTIKSGEVTVVIGPNGCGKSTLLKNLIRIQEYTTGEILVDGIPVAKMKTSELAKKIAYLPQNKKAPDLPVLKMVLHGRFSYLGYPRKYRTQDLEIARKALEWANLNGQEEELVSHLSGGMQQKVYLAMILAQDTQTILLDEPAAYLDVSYQLRLMKMARRLAKEGKAVVMVLHDLSQALRTADHVVVLQEGKIIQEGTPDEVYESGVLQKTFDVEMERIFTKSGWHYVLSDFER